MGKKKEKLEKKEMKFREKLETLCIQETENEVMDFIEHIHKRADMFRTVSSSSKDMNEFSEAYDNLLNIVLKMNLNEARIINSLW